MQAKKLCNKCSVNPRAKHATHCRPCITAHQTEYQNICKAKGLCTGCNREPANKDRTLCTRCAKKRKDRRKETYETNKRRAIAYLGGACVDCGLVTDHYEVYDFDHIDPTTKELKPCSMINGAWNTILAELKKCQLRCSNCHRMRHTREEKPEHWGRSLDKQIAA